ncbi:hypothetical protein ACIO14_24810 [Nocardia fluminea]|uniref:hypothetical protein n=1 Tax=Nocardia fluminea TaxID=134984 RepID=UPI0038201730
MRNTTSIVLDDGTASIVALSWIEVSPLPSERPTGTEIPSCTANPAAAGSS